MFVDIWITFDQRHEPSLLFCFYFARVHAYQGADTHRGSIATEPEAESQLWGSTGKAHSWPGLPEDIFGMWLNRRVSVCVYVCVTLTALVTQDSNQLHQAQQKHDPDIFRQDDFIMLRNRSFFFRVICKDKFKVQEKQVFLNMNYYPLSVMFLPGFYSGTAYPDQHLCKCKTPICNQKSNMF